ncbi:hypothetical protein [Bdellovibrio svalbardensis]|uniref:Uncharacterized protein n=1 Tax=Bdellovibrio svalbardensis TaxID=2972972 RepID=A0ABT6DKW1_9BACT|nr:hypothetical protein [Bdellovibrio svalbardensis]MDG0817511.1 hypothetical protein [Bdellovibrio svalbardensis]
MKNPLIVASLLLVVSSSFGAPSYAKTSTPKVTKVAANGTKLGTSFKFDGSALRGKYQSSLSTKAAVENDKLLEDLLGGRTQFEDRIQQDQERN